MTQPRRAELETTDAGVLPFVDTHVHFWHLRHATLRYGFLTDQSVHPIIGDIDGVRVQRFADQEFQAQTRFDNVSKVIHVEVAFDTPDPVEETRWLHELSEETSRPTAQMVYCDFAADDVRTTLERHRSYSTVRGFRGRNDPRQFDDVTWREGYALLSGTGMVFAHTVGWENIDHAVRLATDFPSVTFCLDQAGMPTSRDPKYFRLWNAALDNLAALPNTVCKVSSLGMADHGWTVESLAPWITACIDSFGTDRCFFGSNWPMDSLFSSYSSLIGAYREIVSRYPAAEQAALLAGNAERIFRI